MILSIRPVFFPSKITMAGVRRLLEEDLELDKKTLDPMKKFINEQLDEVSKKMYFEVLRGSHAVYLTYHLICQQVLNSKSASGVTKKSSVNSKSKKTSKKINTEESSASSASESDEIEDEVKLKKKVVPKGKVQKSEGLKKRKAPVKETKVSNKKQKRLTKTKSEENSDAEDGENVSEDSQSQSAAEKPVKVVYLILGLFKQHPHTHPPKTHTHTQPPTPIFMSKLDSPLCFDSPLDIQFPQRLP